jgi:2-dehydro-3-deoxyphosphooctonate aldolase (KDO 8-P synthase)
VVQIEVVQIDVVQIESVNIGGGAPLGLIAGPCVIESEEHALALASRLADICRRQGVPLIFKASYDKANRTSLGSYRGPGLQEGLRILAGIKRATGLPVLTDVHDPSQVGPAAEVADVLQIPAFLSRQTDLLLEAGRSGRAVNIKKGQFLAPWDLRHAVEKVTSTGNTRILLTERGSSFGYNNLIVDMRSLVILREFGFPVVLDVTHGVQLPGGAGAASGGQPQFIEPLSRAGVAAGVDAIFLEVHEQPERALSDGSNALRLDRLPELLARLKQLDDLIKPWS